MKELFRVDSTNGRYGLAVVGPDDQTLPAQGSLRHLGQVAGVDTYLFVPGETGTWVLPSWEEAVVHGGATVVAQLSLQSYRSGAVLLLGREAVVEFYGYKRRSSRVVAYADGREVEIPATVLAAMGGVAPTGDVAPVEPPPALAGSMAAAFAAALPSDWRPLDDDR